MHRTPECAPPDPTEPAIHPTPRRARHAGIALPPRRTPEHVPVLVAVKPLQGRPGRQGGSASRSRAFRAFGTAQTFRDNIIISRICSENRQISRTTRPGLGGSGSVSYVRYVCARKYAESCSLTEGSELPSAKVGHGVLRAAPPLDAHQSKRLRRSGHQGRNDFF